MKREVCNLHENCVIVYDEQLECPLCECEIKLELYSTDFMRSQLNKEFEKFFISKKKYRIPKSLKKESVRILKMDELRGNCEP